MPLYKLLLLMLLTAALLTKPLTVLSQQNTETAVEMDTTEEKRSTESDKPTFENIALNKILRTLKEKGLIDANEMEDALTALEADNGRKLTVNIDTGRSDGNSVNETLVATLAILLIFGTPVMIVALVSFNGYRRRKLLHDNVNQLITQGKDIPPQLFDYFEGSGNSNNSLKNGLVLIATGIGTLISLSILAGLEVGSIGLIPLFLGLAYLLTWKLTERNKQQAE